MKSKTFLRYIIAGVLITSLLCILDRAQLSREPDKESYMKILAERVYNEFGIGIDLEDITDIEYHSQGGIDITIGIEAKMSNIDETIYQKMSEIIKDDNMQKALQVLDSDFGGPPASYIADCIYNIWLSAPDDVVEHSEWNIYEFDDIKQTSLSKQSFFAVDEEHSVFYYLYVSY